MKNEKLLISKMKVRTSLEILWTLGIIKELEENYKPMSLKNIDKNSQQNISKLN